MQHVSSSAMSGHALLYILSINVHIYLYAVIIHHCTIRDSAGHPDLYTTVLYEVLQGTLDGYIQVDSKVRSNDKSNQPIHSCLLYYFLIHLFSSITLRLQAAAATVSVPEPVTAPEDSIIDLHNNYSTSVVTFIAFDCGSKHQDDCQE